MKTQNLIQMQANVIKITSLTKGSVVKILEKDYSSIQIKYGVVIDLYNTGEESFVQILEYKVSYNDIFAEIKTHSGDQDLALFPATISEVKEYFGKSLEKIAQDIEKDKEELQEKIEGYEKAKNFVSGESAKKLLEVSFEEQTQSEFNTAKKIKEEKFKELED